MVATLFWIVSCAVLVGLATGFLRMIGFIDAWAGSKAREAGARQVEMFALLGIGLALMGINLALAGAV